MVRAKSRTDSSVVYWIEDPDDDWKADLKVQHYKFEQEYAWQGRKELHAVSFFLLTAYGNAHYSSFQTDTTAQRFERTIETTLRPRTTHHSQPEIVDLLGEPNDNTSVRFDANNGDVTLVGDDISSSLLATVGAGGGSQVVTKFSSNDLLGRAKITSLRAGAGNWSGYSLLRVLEVLDESAAEFVAEYGRLAVTDNGGNTPTYRFYEVNRKGVTYSDKNPAERFPDILNGRGYFAIRFEIPKSFNDLQAAEYLLSVLAGSAANGDGVSSDRISRLYHAKITRGDKDFSIESFQASKRAQLASVAEQSEAYASFWYETLASATGAGGLALAVYKFQEAGAAAGAMEALFSMPIGKITKKLGSKVVKVVPLKIGGKILADIPVEAIHAFQRANAVGKEEFLKSLKAAKKLNGEASDKAVIEAYEVFLHRNGISKLITDRGTATKLLNRAMKDIPSNLPSDVGQRAHHIIPVKLFDEDFARRINDDFGIELNGAENGVWLPFDDYPGRTASLHRGNHLGALKSADGTLKPSYTEKIREEFQRVKTREDALELLEKWRDMLLNNKGLLYNEPGL